MREGDRSASLEVEEKSEAPPSKTEDGAPATRPFARATGPSVGWHMGGERPVCPRFPPFLAVSIILMCASQSLDNTAGRQLI
jgi:hypothetical protein